MGSIDVDVASDSPMATASAVDQKDLGQKNLLGSSISST